MHTRCEQQWPLRFVVLLEIRSTPPSKMAEPEFGELLKEVLPNDNPGWSTADFYANYFRARVDRGKSPHYELSFWWDAWLDHPSSISQYDEIAERFLVSERLAMAKEAAFCNLGIRTIVLARSREWMSAEAAAARAVELLTEPSVNCQESKEVRKWLAIRWSAFPELVGPPLWQTLANAGHR